MQNALDLVRIWVIVVSCFCAGSWVLSAARSLGGRGYLALFAVIILILIGIGRVSGWTRAGAIRVWRKLKRRFRRPLPLSFLVISAINLISGAINEVTNGDSIGYRIPRTLHWLSEGRWHWIHTADDRLNVVGLNYEFLGAPFLFFFGDERWIYLVSIGGYLLLPGLFFSFLRLVGVGGRVAWWWMWLFAAGYVYAMQASSIATDGFSATAALAAVVFALRGALRQNAADLWFAILAAAFLSGIKQVTLPLGIIVAFPILSGFKILLRRPAITGAVVVIALLASVLPITIANVHYAGSWKGFNKENPYEQKSFLWGFIGNSFVIPVQNLQPPIFPAADRWNDAMRRFVRTPFGSRFQHFETFAALWRAPSEINAGLGFGLSILILATALALARANSPSRFNPKKDSFIIRWVIWTPVLAAAAWMGKSGLMQNARYFAPYYPFLMPLLLRNPNNFLLTRRIWWRRLAWATILLLIGLLIISRQRPVWPAGKVTAWLTARYPENRFVKKVRNAYSFSARKEPLRRSITQLIPDSAKVVGYSAENGKLEMPLWTATPGRRVHWIKLDDDPLRPRQLGIEYVLVDPSAIQLTPGKSIDSWLQRFPGAVIGQFGIIALPETEPEIAYVVKLAR